MGVPGGGDEPALIRQMLGAGKSKPALERAKDNHKRAATPESEGLLVEAYLARIEALMESGMATEARAMAGLVLERYEAARRRRGELELLLAAHGTLESLVRPLADPALAPETRAALEGVLRQRLTDPGELASCGALPEEHPLRRGAAAVAAALAAAATRPVSEEELALPEISRRSPLAPWKLLARALGAFYRHEDEACRRALEAIEPDSAPARLAPVLLRMMDPVAGEPPRGAAQALANRVGGSREALRHALERLDREFVELRPGRVLRAIREAMEACRRDAPELVEPLLRRIGARAWLEGAPPEEIRTAAGGPALKDAAFWRLLARTAETLGNRVLTACSFWEQFRRHAVAEGWFMEGSLAEAGLYLHMAGLYHEHAPRTAAQARELFAEQSKGLGTYYHDQPKAIREAGRAGGHGDFYFTDPDQLYARACAIDPDAETYRQWLAWSRGHNDNWKTFESVAQAWHAARPGDPEPLLELMTAAETRGALGKALGWLEEAERRDPLSPAVRRARLRLLISTALRHLKQQKGHLLERDLAELEALPQAREGDRPALLATLRWAGAARAAKAHDLGEVARQREAVVALLGSEVEAELLYYGVLKACGERNPAEPRPPASKGRPGRKKKAAGEAEAAAAEATAGELSKPASLVEVMARVLAIGEDMHMPMEIPRSWDRALEKEAERADCPASPPALARVGEAAFKGYHNRLAFAASGAGLAPGGPLEARFLLLRALSVSAWAAKRQADCFRGAITLARRQRDTALVAEAIDRWRTLNRGITVALADEELIDELSRRELDPAHLERVLARERKARRGELALSMIDETYFKDCPCVECRRGRGELPPPAAPQDVFNDYGPDWAADDDWDDEEDEGLEDEFGNLPPGAIKALLQMLEGYISTTGKVPSPEEIKRKDPELFAEISAMMEEYAHGGGLPFDDEDGPFFDDFLPPRQNTKTRRKKHGKHGKHKK